MTYEIERMAEELAGLQARLHEGGHHDWAQAHASERLAVEEAAAIARKTQEYGTT